MSIQWILIACIGFSYGECSILFEKESPFLSQCIELAEEVVEVAAQRGENSHTICVPKGVAI